MKLTDNAVAKALAKMHGNVSAAANALSVSRHAIDKRIKNSEELQEVLTQSRESMLDDAESALYKAVLEGAPWAVQYALTYLGRKRGYQQKHELEHTGNTILDLTYEIVTHPTDLTPGEKPDASQGAKG